MADQQRSAKADNKVDCAGKQHHFDLCTVIDADGVGGTEEVRQPEHVDQRGILAQHDALGEQQRHHGAERLRQDHQLHRLPLGHAQRQRGVTLTAGDAEDAGTNNFGVVGGFKQREGHHRRDQTNIGLRRQPQHLLQEAWHHQMFGLVVEECWLTVEESVAVVV